MSRTAESSTTHEWSPSVYLDAERTQLAWMRSGVALMGFGFVVARFGLVLKELSRVNESAVHHHDRASLTVGIVLVMLGAAVHINGVVHHALLVRKLNRGELPKSRMLSSASILTVLLALFGMAVGVYLTFNF